MLPIVLAALSAVVWGVGDFSGGKATQTSRALAVTVLSQLASLPVLAVCVVLVGGGALTIGILIRGALAGMVGLAGILLLYWGLSQGAMSVFAPVSAVTAALVPLGVGLAVDRTPSVPALIGAGCAVVAIGLVSRAPGCGRSSASGSAPSASACRSSRAPGPCWCSARGRAGGR